MNFLKKLFKQKSQKSGIVFIVEDNPAYAKTIQLYIKSSFPQLKEVKIFPVGETCIMELNLNPDLIIIDYFLNSKYHDAKTGLETISEIRELKPEANIIVLSSQNSIDVMLEAVQRYECSYIKKDDQVFDRLEEIMQEIGYTPA